MDCWGEVELIWIGLAWGVRLSCSCCSGGSSGCIFGLLILNITSRAKNLITAPITAISTSSSQKGIWKLYWVPIGYFSSPLKLMGLFWYCEYTTLSKPYRNIERYSKGQQIGKTVSRGTKKPPTSRKGMISTGTSAITTPASEKRVERNSPKEELMNAQSYIESRVRKNVPALLSRLQGKQATARKRKTVMIQTGCTAETLAKKQADVEQVLLSLSRMKTGRSKLKRLTEAKTQLKPVFMMRKKRTPWLFWMISLQVVPFQQQRMMQMTPKKMAWKTFRMTSRGCRNWLIQHRTNMEANWVSQGASYFQSTPFS